MSARCQVCLEGWSYKQRAPVNCPYCEQSVCCRKCLESYLLSVPEEPLCINTTCRQPWTPDFVDSNVTKTFMNGRLREHRETMLVDRETAMLPATQIEVERVLKEREMHSEIRKLTEGRAAIDRQIAELTRRRASMSREVARVYGNIADLRRAFRNGSRNRQWISYMRPCAADGCRGFLGTDFRCGLCKAQVCKTCHVLLATSSRQDTTSSRQDTTSSRHDTTSSTLDHVCSESDVASVNVIENDSRPCPKCGSMIHRISGCSQMFCTVPGCRTPFDWNTGRIITGRLHNPHYFEFLRREEGPGGAGTRAGRVQPNLGRELDDIPCGGLPSYEQMSEMLASDFPYRKVILEALRGIIFVQEDELRFSYAPQPPVDFDSNQDLRVKYLLGEMTREEMSKILQKRDKQRQKINAINHVLSTLVNVSSDLYRSLVIRLAPGSPSIHGNVKFSEDMTQFVDFMHRLRIYINEALVRVGNRFSCVVPNLSDSWGMLRLSPGAATRAARIAPRS